MVRNERILVNFLSLSPVSEQHSRYLQLQTLWDIRVLKAPNGNRYILSCLIAWNVYISKLTLLNNNKNAFEFNMRSPIFTIFVTCIHMKVAVTPHKQAICYENLNWPNIHTLWDTLSLAVPMHTHTIANHSKRNSAWNIVAKWVQIRPFHICKRTVIRIFVQLLSTSQAT